MFTVTLRVYMDARVSTLVHNNFQKFNLGIFEYLKIIIHVYSHSIRLYGRQSVHLEIQSTPKKQKQFREATIHFTIKNQT